MAHTIYAGVVSKKRNSTLVPSLSTAFNVVLKTPTSLHTPTFTINAATFPYNYLKWDDRYYFVTDVTSVHYGLFEVSAVVDVLATYRAQILASTQFVSYSSLHGATWLPDTRIPIKKNAIIAKNTANLDFASTTGAYVLSVVGQSGVDTYTVSREAISSIIADLQDWCDTDVQALIANIDPSSPETAIASLAEINAQVGLVGNSYEVAVQCIRSCHWVPFSRTLIDGASGTIYLGEYNTHQTGNKVINRVVGNVGISLPWHFSDWRRAYSEKMYLYLPFVGCTSLNVDELINLRSIDIKYSISAGDGQVCYEVKAGDHIIGTYGGNCKMEVPIGINQASSLGDIATTLMQGAEKVVSSGVHTAELAGKANVIGAAGAGAQTAFESVSMMYNTANVALSTNLTTIGGIGGGAGAGLDLSAAVISVANDTVIEPTVMTATMGQPTMKPVKLGSLHGYCQCANAHVAAPAELQELNEIDAYLNSGFYIE
jgi:hypothetical protein